MPKAKPVTLKVAGRTLRFPTLGAAAIHFGLNPRTVEARKRQYGWTLRQALEIDARKPKEFTQTTVMVDGKTVKFNSFAAAAAHFGVNAGTAYQRHHYGGWTLEEAFGVQSRHIRHSQSKELVCRINGVSHRFETHKAAAESRGINPRLFRHRLNVRGWSLEEALELVPRREPKRSSKSVTVFERGKPTTFRSLGVAARHFGIAYHTAWIRQKKGWTLEQALGLEPAPLHAKSCFGEIYVVTQISTGLQYVGQTITSIVRRWSWHIKQANLGRNTLLHRAIRKCGLSDFAIRRVATAESRHDLNTLERDWVARMGSLHPNGFNLTEGGGAGPIRTEVFEVDGIEFDSLAHACRHFGISTQAVNDRRERQGMSIEEALKAEIYKGKKIAVRGMVFSSHKQAIDHFHADETLVRARLHMGWSVEDAFFMPDQRGTPITVNGTEFPSMTKAAEHYGVAYSKVHQRIMKFGWTAEEAVGLVARPKQKSTRGTAVFFRYAGKTYRYSSLNDAAKTAGISGARLRGRRKLKWSWPEALGLADRKTSSKSH